MSDGSIPETTDRLPDLDITQYDHWRDFLYKLQTGETVLVGLEKGKSAEIGHYGYSIAVHLIQNLRESQLNENGEPYVIFVDDVKDDQVITESPPDIRQKFFLSTFLSQSKRNSFPDLPDRANSYVTASVALGKALTGLDQINVANLLAQALEKDTSLMVADKLVLSDSLSKINSSDVKELTDYLQFSQTQMLNEEQRMLVTAQKNAPEIGSEPLTIGGEEYSFVKNDFPRELGANDIGLLVPLKNAAKKGRQEMVQQALEYAFQYLNIDREKFQNHKPPAWWVNGEDGEGLRSNEILIYIPYEAQKFRNKDTPAFVEKMMGDADFKFGWNKLVFSKNAPNQIVSVVKLNN